MKRYALVFLVAVLMAGTAAAAPAGTRVLPTSYDFDTLVQRLKQAVEANGMFIVAQASASAGAERRGIAIPGNYVAGVFRNDLAVRMLEASVPAGIEAPIRFYVTAHADGTATLSYKTPSSVFAPYDGGPELDALARELDALFAKIAAETVAG